MYAVVSAYMGYNLFTESEESVFVGFFVFVNMNRRYFKGIVAFGGNLFVCGALVILPDVYHQHMQMQ